MKIFSVLSLMLRFWPLITLAMKIAEEAGDENGWTGEEKQRHAVMVMQALAEAFHIALPDGLFGEVTTIFDSLVRVFHMVGIFKSKDQKVASPARIEMQAQKAQEVIAKLPATGANDARLDELEAQLKR